MKRWLIKLSVHIFEDYELVIIMIIVAAIASILVVTLV